MINAANRNFKFESNDDFWEKCNDADQKEKILTFLHTGDSYYCDLKINTESIEQVQDRDIKLQLILRLPESNFRNDFEKVVNELREKKSEEESTLTFDYLLNYFLNKSFNDFSCPEEIYHFLLDYSVLIFKYPNETHDCAKQFFNCFDKNFDFDNYFYYKGPIKLKFLYPKQSFFDLCLEKKMYAFAAYAFAYLPPSEQTTENFKKIPKEFRVPALAISPHMEETQFFEILPRAWEFIDCLSTEQKKELVDKKIITEEFISDKQGSFERKGLLAKWPPKLLLTCMAISIAVLLACLISLCVIYAPILSPMVFPVLASMIPGVYGHIGGTFFLGLAGIALCIFNIISGGCNLYKINKFNEEVGQNKATTLNSSTPERPKTPPKPPFKNPASIEKEF